MVDLFELRVINFLIKIEYLLPGWLIELFLSFSNLFWLCILWNNGKYVGELSLGFEASDITDNIFGDGELIGFNGKLFLLNILFNIPDCIFGVDVISSLIAIEYTSGFSTIETTFGISLIILGFEDEPRFLHVVSFIVDLESILSLCIKQSDSGDNLRKETKYN